MPIYIVMLGLPGAGKGTQAEILSQKLGLPHVSSGNIFRENIKKRTKLGMQVREILERGDLVSDDVTNAIIEKCLNRTDHKTGAILDGYPRTPAQADALDLILEKLGGEVDSVPYIEVPKELLIKRLSARWTCRAEGHVYNMNFNPPKNEGICDFDGSELFQRDDDRAETIARRIDVYFEVTAPLIEHYRMHAKLVEIAGDQAIEKVTEDLLAALPKVEANQ